MAQEKLEDLSMEMLRKRKRTAVFFLRLMTGVILVNLCLMVFTFFRDGKINFGVWVPGIFVFFFIFIFASGIKKINIELKRRENL